MTSGEVVVVVVVAGAEVVVVVGAKVVVVEVVDVVVVVVTTGEATAAHEGAVMVLVSKVTAPVLAKIRPCTVLPVSTVSDICAITVPTKVLVVPIVAELPTCQNTLHACAPFIRLTVLADAVVRVEPAWNINTAFALFWPSNIKVPVSPIDDAEL